MKTTELSYIEISANVIKEHCKKMIKQIIDGRQTRWNEQVTNYINQFNNRWWNKFWNKTITREQAENHLKNDDSWGLTTYYWTMREYETQEDICNSIMNLCEHAGDDIIRLTAKDARGIGL